MNAADPASLCNMDIPAGDSALPRRVPTTHMVFRGSTHILTSLQIGGTIEIHSDPPDPALPEHLSFLTVLLSRQERSPGRPVSHPVSAILTNLGIYCTNHFRVPVFQPKTRWNTPLSVSR